MAVVLIAAAGVIAWRPELLLGRQEPVVRSVVIFPPAAAKEGAAWRLAGQWRPQGRQEGDETLWAVEFKPVPDWETPAPVLIPQGARGVDVRGVYQPAPFSREAPVRVAGSVVLADAAEEWARLALRRAGAAEVRRLPGRLPDSVELEGVFFATRSRRSIEVRAVGTDAGITALASGACDLALSSRPLTAAEAASGLEARLVARDALAVVVAPSNPVRMLDLDTVRAIFSGRIQRWSDVGGPDLPITVVDLDTQFGTRRMFHEVVMQGLSIVQGRRAASPAIMDSVVASDPGAIGFTSVPMVRQSVPVAIRIAGDGPAVPPHAASLQDGSYPLMRSLFIVTRRNTSVQWLVDAVVSSEGRQAAQRFGFVVPPEEP